MSHAVWKSLEGAVVDGKYHLKTLIGVDAEGAVFQAERLAARRRPAAVRLAAAGTCGDEARIRELAAAGARHQNLVACFGAGLWQASDQPLFYFAVELAERQLAGLIRHWPLSVGQAHEVVQGVASALCHLHGGPSPVVHQGVRPSQVILAEGQWKLSEFGAVPAGGPLQPDDVRSARAYTPPEGFDGVVSPAGDVWSLGVLIVRALTGALPFQDDSEAGLKRAVCSKAPTIKAPLPVPFGVIVAGCLQKDPGSRWTAEQVLAAVPSSTAPTRANPVAENYRWVAWAVATLTGLIAIVGGAFFMMSGPVEERPRKARGQAPAQAEFLVPQGGTSGRKVSPGGGQQAKLIRHVEPEYPLAAREARISGMVRLHVVVDKEGVVRNLRVVSGPSPLVPPAIRAVRQWLFQPLLHNGQPTAFETEVDLQFAPP
jgi:TonB family protein